MNGAQVYHDSPKMEDREELLAGSDMDASSIDDRKHWSSQAARWSNGRSLISKLRDYSWLITTVMMSIIIVLQLAIWNEVRANTPNSVTQPGGDYKGKGPTC